MFTISILVASTTGASAAPPGTLFELAPSAQREVDAALRDGFFLPMLVRSQPDEAENRIELQRVRLLGILRAFGFLDGIVDVRSSLREGGASRLTFWPRPGPVYRVGAVTVSLVDKGDVSAEQLSGSITTYIGLTVRADVLGDMSARILHWFHDASYPFAKVVRRGVRADADTALAIVEIDVQLGQAAIFGDLTWTGVGPDRARAFAAMAPWNEGDPYQRSKLDLFREKLLSLDDVMSVEYELAEFGKDIGLVPVTAHVKLAPIEDRLSHQKLLGGAVLLSTLISLMGSQVMVSAGIKASSIAMVTCRIFSIALMLLASLLLVQRAILFAQ